MVQHNPHQSITYRPYIFDKYTGYLSLPGSYSQYNLTLLTFNPQDYHATRLNIIDTRSTAGNFIESGVRYINFNDIQGYSIQEGIPLHVQDIIDVSIKNSPIQIAASQLFSNDLNLHNKSLSIKTISNMMGCNLIKNKDQILTVELTPNYAGIRSFDYSIESQDGELNSSPVSVYLRTEDLPKDPELFNQWYLFRSNIIPAWSYYTGQNVKVAVLDEGIVPLHQDIVDNLRTAAESFPQYGASISADKYFHALGVAGTIAAARNGKHLVGVAYDAQIASYQVNFGPLDTTTSMQFFKDYDIINNSWAANIGLYLKDTSTHDLSKQREQIYQDFKDATSQGRQGLGSIIVFAAGNDQHLGIDSHDHHAKSSPYVITVGGLNKPLETLSFESLMFRFASTGSSNLICAPASNFLTLHAANLRINQNLQISHEDTTQYVAGTSFAAPLVSGVIALMLEANPKLGWRDIQNILSLSAMMFDPVDHDIHHTPSTPDISNTTATKSIWQYNKAKYLNGAGLHYSQEFGFGEVDAYSAVKLAESWLTQQTSKNMKTITHSTSKSFTLEPLKNGSNKYSFSVNENIEIEFASLNIDLMVKSFGGLSVNLISPSGTVSALLNKPGKGKTVDISNVLDEISGHKLKGKLCSNHFRGETSVGKWILELQIDETQVQTFSLLNLISPQEAFNNILNSFDLKIYGRESNYNQQIFFTDELYINNPNPKYIPLPNDSKFTTINLAAFSGDSTLDLGDLNNTRIASYPLVFNFPNNIANLVGGDGNEHFIGSKTDNIFVPGRGQNNIFTSNGGNDIIYIPNLKTHHGKTTITDFNSNLKIQIGHNASFADISAYIKDMHATELAQSCLTSPSMIATLANAIKNNITISPDLLCLHNTVIETKEWSIVLIGAKASDLNVENFIFADLFL